MTGCDVRAQLQSAPICVGNLLMILGFAIALNGWAMYLVAVPGYLLFSAAMVIAAVGATTRHGDLRKNMERLWDGDEVDMPLLEYACPRLHVGENDDVRGSTT